MKRRTALAVLCCAIVLGAGASPASGWHNAYRPNALPAKLLAPIGPCGQLRKPAAAAWNTLRLAAARRHLLARPTGCHGSAYRLCGRPGDGRRGLNTQWGFYERLGPRYAAIPCHSNHGKGWAIDSSTIGVVQALGRKLGFQKRWPNRRQCEDALWEPWHFKWCPVWHKPDPGTSLDFPLLRNGSGGAGQGWYVRRLQRHLRRHGSCPRLPLDGQFGDRTTRCVIRFQASHGLAGDGRVGKATWKWLRRPARAHTTN